MPHAVHATAGMGCVTYLGIKNDLWESELELTPVSLSSSRTDDSVQGGPYLLPSVNQDWQPARPLS